MLDLEPYQHRVRHSSPVCVYGRVVDVVGLTVEATGPGMRIGDLCYVQPRHGGERVPVEVVGFRGKRILLMPLGDMHGIAPDSLLIPTSKPQTVRVGDELLGRVIDSMGVPIDGGPVPKTTAEVALTAAPPRPLERTRIEEPVATGIRAIDGCITCGKGQRIGIFAGSGVGKSTLLGMIARSSSADVNVIAMIGERGREVREFIEKHLGEEGMEKGIRVKTSSYSRHHVNVNMARAKFAGTYANSILANMEATEDGYDEALLLLRRQGFDIGADADRADWRQTRVENDTVRAAWRDIYRDPRHHWELYELAEKLVDFEDYFRRWRFNHVTTVERIIGFKRGTGGTEGVGYLRKMLDVVLFPELWSVRTAM